MISKYRCKNINKNVFSHLIYANILVLIFMILITLNKVYANTDNQIFSKNKKHYIEEKKEEPEEEGDIFLSVNSDNKCKQVNILTTNINYNKITVCFDSKSKNEQEIHINVTITNRYSHNNRHQKKLINIMPPYFISNRDWNCSQYYCTRKDIVFGGMKCFPSIQLFRTFNCITKNCTLKQKFKAIIETENGDTLIAKTKTDHNCDRSIASNDDGCPIPNAFITPCNDTPIGITLNVEKIKNQLFIVNFTNNSPYDFIGICIYFNNCYVNAITNNDWVLTSGTTENLFYSFIGNGNKGLPKGETTCYLTYGSICSSIQNFQFQAYYWTPNDDNLFCSPISEIF